MNFQYELRHFPLLRHESEIAEEVINPQIIRTTIKTGQPAFCARLITKERKKPYENLNIARPCCQDRRRNLS
jgi:hypothetical protein